LTLQIGVTLQGSSVGTATIKLKNTTNADLITLASGNHTGTAIRNLTLDGNGANQTTGNIITATPTTLGDFTVEGNTLLNAAVHSMYLAEGTPALPVVRKVIRDNVVNGHGVASTGYGIYLDYAAPALIEGNWVYTTNGNDNIELGHTTHTATNYSYQCIGNVCIGAQLQFPFSDGAEIIGNLVINATIQNDANTANNVSIIGNRVENAAPTAGFSGINVTGSNAIIKGNRVRVSTLNGVGCNASTMKDSVIQGNVVETTSASNSGSGITTGA